MKEYIKVYTPQEYRKALTMLQERGCKWNSGRDFFYKCGRTKTPFHSFFGGPFALVVNEDNKVCVDEIRHCPDPSDRRLEYIRLKKGDKVRLTEKYGEYQSHKDEVFEIVSGPTLVGGTPCVFLDHGGFGAYACDGLARI